MIEFGGDERVGSWEMHSCGIATFKGGEGWSSNSDETCLGAVKKNNKRNQQMPLGLWKTRAFAAMLRLPTFPISW